MCDLVRLPLDALLSDWLADPLRHERERGVIQRDGAWHGARSDHHTQRTVPVHGDPTGNRLVL